MAKGARWMGELWKYNKKKENFNKILELHDVELTEEKEKEKAKKSKVLENTKKTLNINWDFRSVTSSVGKGKSLGLRSIQDEEVIAYHNKEKKYKKIMLYGHNYFSKVKESEVWNDKMYGNIIDDKIGDKILSGELNREYCDESNVQKFICLLKYDQKNKLKP